MLRTVSLLSSTLRCLRTSTTTCSQSRPFASSARLFRPAEMDRVNTTHRLEQLRELMRKNKVDLYSMLLARRNA